MQKRKKKKAFFTETKQAYLFLLPAILGLTFITIIPLIGVLVISFTDWSGLSTPNFVGFKNYIDIFSKDYFFKKSVLVTLIYAIGAVICGIVYSFCIALLLNMNIPGRGFFRAIFYIPYIIPSIAVYIVWTWMYDPNFGLFNFLLSKIGASKSMWLSAPGTAIPSLIIIAMWGAGNLIVIFLAGLQNVPIVYHEAAKIDGANSLSRFRHITIPMMTPIIFYNFLMSVITHMQVFVPSYSITKGGPANSTLFLVYHLYREGFQNNRLGYSSAISFIFFIMIGILTVIIFKFSNKFVFYEGGD